MRMVYYDKDFLIKANEFIDYYKSCGRKSLPYAWVEKHGHTISRSYTKPCDYLKVVDEVFGL